MNRYTNGVTGQDGWSNTSSDSNGFIFSSSTSGEYTGGKALAGSASSNGHTYIGGKAGTLLSSNTFTFDMYWNNGESYVGGWADAATVGTFANAEAGFMAGQVRVLGTDYFGIRSAGFGANRIVSSVSGTTGHWYRTEVSISGSTTVTLKVRDLTTGTDVDFDVAPGIQNWTTTLTAGEFGVATSSYTGVATRVTGLSAVDNLQSGAVEVPEPASLAVLALGGVALLARRRR